MQLTLFTRHALSVLVHLARTPQRLSTIAEVARTYNISRYHLMKIVSELSKAGFVEAVRGRKGGIRIARSPGEITLGDIVRHTEAGIAPAENDPGASSGLKLWAEAVGQAFANFWQRSTAPLSMMLPTLRTRVAGAARKHGCPMHQIYG